jgi:hypothetical protein
MSSSLIKSTSIGGIAAHSMAGTMDATASIGLSWVAGLAMVAAVQAVSIPTNTWRTPVTSHIQYHADTSLPSAANSIANHQFISHPPFLAAWERIRILGTYEDGWKGPGSVGASQQAVDDAETLAFQLFEGNDVIPPRIGLASDGEFVFSWNADGVVIDLSVVGDGTYSFYAQAGKETFLEDAAPIDRRLPERLLAALRASQAA